MDQHSGDGFNNLFADSNQQYQAYHDNSFLNGNDPNFPEATWALNASGYNPNPALSRVTQPGLPNWQNASHLSAPLATGNINGQPAPYARSLSHSPAPFGQNNYTGYNVHQNLQQYQQQPQYDPALFGNPAQDFNTNFNGYGNHNQSLGTIAPQALQQEIRSPTVNVNAYTGINYAQNAFNQSRFASMPAVKSIDQIALMQAIPKGTDNGYLSTIDFDEIVRATSTERMGKFLTIGKEAQEWPVNRTTTLPHYVPRKSKNELRRLAGNDQVLLDKIGKKSLKHKALTTAPVASSAVAVAKGTNASDERIKYEGETSSSEESDDDDSLYSSEEESAESPLPQKRPDTPKDAVEYDTIKALWSSKRKPLAASDIRTALVTFWEIVKTIRDRWKIDQAAVTQAEEKNRVGELPLLRSRVKDQRDMIEVACKAALKHGHRSIVDNLGQNQSLVFVCYQFLLDRFKEDDLNGSLSRAILELMTRFTTLSDAVLEKTHLVKVLPKYARKGDAKTQHYAKRIMAAAAAVAANDAAEPTTATQHGAGKPVTVASPLGKRVDQGAVAGVKRAASSVAEGVTVKRVATVATKATASPTASNSNGVVKKTFSGAESAKTTAAAAPATKTKQVTAKPSAFFSSLQSAAKKPGTSIKSGASAQASGAKAAERKMVLPTTTAATSAAPKSTFSFAETIANLGKPKEEKVATKKPEKEAPPETPEQLAKRLRKETRRKLNVRFKLGEELVEIRYFTHDPDEETGHDDSQMRDVSDVGGEGRMLKMHQDMMDVDDEGDEADDGPEPTLIAWKAPTPVDFTVIDDEERSKNFSRFGGSLQTESEERKAREQYEANTLIVFYPDRNDIPPTPKEPANPLNGEPATEKKVFGAPNRTFAARATQRKAMRPQPYPAQQHMPANQQSFNMSALNQFGNNQHRPTSASMLASQSTTPPPNIDIQQLLASLQQALPQNQAVQQPQAQPLPNWAPPPAMAPQPNGQHIDLSAIMAAIGGHPQMQAPQMGGRDDNNPDDPMSKRHRDQGDKSRFYKTKVCKYWEDGRCMKGDSCTYLHERPPP
ncbi:hypothetical protein BAUCODRAFT_78523 [Baudoinia panamericana UAMH 10762]|uniref:C3H1-type domain-containing protein n=1 Tax=Baudoinia panamericana (strain UAMH 10762) TaxID=717646 RepID=M2LEC7_BAUPA|nr:uncharacterized protein BAUCODRAFT_78523 [Baudoinia panamericana UAMH 10762]EMC92347.1 hypothetical protein BAUCODRAFT_78523 [Baudoinia panamericana UAMH 10762]